MRRARIAAIPDRPAWQRRAFSRPRAGLQHGARTRRTGKGARGLKLGPTQACRTHGARRRLLLQPSRLFRRSRRSCGSDGRQRQDQQSVGSRRYRRPSDPISCRSTFGPKPPSTPQSRHSHRAAAVGHPKMEPPITTWPADHRKPAQLGNFTSAHLGKFEVALTVNRDDMAHHRCRCPGSRRGKLVSPSYGAGCGVSFGSSQRVASRSRARRGESWPSGWTAEAASAEFFLV